MPTVSSDNRAFVRSRSSIAMRLSHSLATFGLVALSSLALAQTAMHPQDQTILDAVRAKHAPDSRTALLDVSARRTADGVVTLEGRTDSPGALADLRAAYYVKHIPTDVRVRLLPNRDDLHDKTWVIVRAPVTSVTDPTTGETVSVPMGTPARRLEDTAGRTLLQLPDGTIGEAPSDDLRAVDDTGILIWNRRDKLIVTKDGAAFAPDNPQGDSIEFITLSRDALLRLERREGSVWHAALPDGRLGTIAASEVEPLADRQKREEDARRASPNDFMKRIADTAREVASAHIHSDGGAFLRDVFRRHDLIIQRDPDMLAAIYPSVAPGKRFDAFKPGDILIFQPSEGRTRAGISLGGSRYVAVPGNGIEDFRQGSRQDRLVRQRALVRAVRIDPGFLNDPCLTSTRSNPYWQAPVNALVPCSKRADIPQVR